VPEGRTPQEELARLVRFTRRSYPGSFRPNRGFVGKELALIKSSTTRYFLTVHDIVNYAGSRKFSAGTWLGRQFGVCYVLGITSVNQRPRSF